MERKGKKKIVFIVIGIFVAISVILGISINVAKSQFSNTPASTNSSTVDTSSIPAETPPASQTKKEDLEVLEYSTENNGYTGYIIGKIKNNTNKKYSYAQISINLYNGDSQVGSTLDNINNLEPGGVWSFKAPVIDKNVTSYKIVNVIGY